NIYRLSNCLSQRHKLSQRKEQLLCHNRKFLLRNVGALPPAGSAELQRLVSLSMVWANHVFLGCRYPPQVMGKALEMAEGIQVIGAPVRTTRDELVAKVKKRGISSSNG
uniref:XRN2-binding (XTBD) domain-containing protein n=1 Tax=Apteryx owenii TaxID=8824 RepID=A0A8B9PIT5_APTOW